jgi:signal transduction histidine kinase
MPVPVDGDGLAGALRDLASVTRQLDGVECSFHCDEPVFTPDNFYARHLYRIAQEAVSNAVRHGEATRIEIRLCQDERVLILTVEDNGRGFPAQESKSKGLGLKVADYRARQMGAALAIEPGKTGGVVVSCRVPCQRR